MVTKTKACTYVHTEARRYVRTYVSYTHTTGSALMYRCVHTKLNVLGHLGRGFYHLVPVISDAGPEPLRLRHAALEGALAPELQKHLRQPSVCDV